MASDTHSPIVQDDFSLGIIRDVSPDLIDPRAVFDAINAPVDSAGALYKRGGTVNKSDEAFGSAGLRFIWDGYLNPGRRTLFANPTDFGVLDSDDVSPVNLGSDGLTAPKQTAVINSVDEEGNVAAMLFIGGGYIYGGSRKAADYTTGTVTMNNGSRGVVGASTAWDANADAGMLFQISGSERVYLVDSIDSDTALTLAEEYDGVTAAGVTYTLYPIYKITVADPYESSATYAVCANRLVVADGEKLRFSEVEAPDDFTVTVGGPDGTSIRNEHILPEGARIIGLGVIGQTLFIFTTAGIWTLDGLAFDIVDVDGNPQHRLQRLSGELILHSAPGLVAYQQTLIVPCLDGIYLIDGMNAPQRLSTSISSLYRLYVSKGYVFGQATVFESHYLLPILSAAANSNKDLLVGRLDRVSETNIGEIVPWVHFANAGGSIAGFAVRALDTSEEPTLLGAESQSTSRVVDCSGYFRPTKDNATDADGTAHEWVVVTRDYFTGNGTENVVRKLAARVELLDTDNNDNPTIEAEYGFGVNREGGELWDFENWAADTADPATEEELVWEAEEDAVFFEIPTLEITENIGTERYRGRVNKRARIIRYRLRNTQPCSYLRLRSLEQFIRPSRAVRK